MVSCGDRICNVNEMLDRYNVFDIHIPNNERMADFVL